MSDLQNQYVDNKDLVLSTVILSLVFIQRVSFSMLWDGQKERDRLTEGERLIEERGEENKGQSEPEYYSPF